MLYLPPYIFPTNSQRMNANKYMKELKNYRYRFLNLLMILLSQRQTISLHKELQNKRTDTLASIATCRLERKRKNQYALQYIHVSRQTHLVFSFLSQKEKIDLTILLIQTQFFGLIHPFHFPQNNDLANDYASSQFKKNKMIFVWRRVLRRQTQSLLTMKTASS